MLKKYLIVAVVFPAVMISALSGCSVSNSEAPRAMLKPESLTNPVSAEPATARKVTSLEDVNCDPVALSGTKPSVAALCRAKQQ